MAKKNNTSKLITAAVIAVGGYFLYEKFFKNNNSSNAGNNAGSTTPGTATGTNIPAVPAASAAPSSGSGTTNNNSYPIVYNKYHPDVKPLQWYLGVTQDGIIGPKSLSALQSYIPEFTQRFTIPSKAAMDNLIQEIADIKNALTEGDAGSDYSDISGVNQDYGVERNVPAY